MKTYVPALFLAISLASASAAQAQQRETFTINPAASKIAFTLGGNTHQVEGTFRVQNGSIEFGPGPGVISGSVVVAADSGNSGNSSRDRDMNKKVLQTKRFPEVSFVPKSYKGQFAPADNSTIQVSGVFTLHGTPHDLTVPMHIRMDGSKMSATGSFEVPYVKWGMKDPSILFLRVAKVVGIQLNLTGTISPSH